MSNLLTREFVAATAERAVKTAAQTAIALIGTEQVGILNLDWAQIASVVATATVLSVLTSIAGDTTSKNGPSFVRAEGIGVESAEAEAALLRERAREAHVVGEDEGEDPSFEEFTDVISEPTDDESHAPFFTGEDDESEEDLDGFTHLSNLDDEDDEGPRH